MQESKKNEMFKQIIMLIDNNLSKVCKIININFLKDV